MMGRLEIVMKINNYVHFVKCTIMIKPHTTLGDLLNIQYIFLLTKEAESHKDMDLYSSLFTNRRALNVHRWLVASQQTQHIEPTLALHWPISCDNGPTLLQCVVKLFVRRDMLVACADSPLQSQKAASAYLKREQILPFSPAWRCLRTN